MSSIYLPKWLCVENDVLALVANLICLFGVVFILINGLWLEKGYQETDIGTGTVFTQVLGWADTRDRVDLPEAYRRVWNAPEIAGPVQDEQALFIMTNAIITPGQQLRNCPEDGFIDAASCLPNNTTNCIKGKAIAMSGNGIMTGRCVTADSERTNQSHSCEVTGWCPVEGSKFPNPPLLVEAAKELSIVMKVTVNFPKFKVDMSNSEANLERNCEDEKDNYWRCPIFSVNSLLEQAGILDLTTHNIAREGGLISVTLKWNCNFDLGQIRKDCKPTYELKLENSTASTRAFWNYRHINEYRDANNTLTRDVLKKVGIVFIFNIDARAGKYDFFTTFICLGAAFGYFRMAPAVCGIIVSVFAVIYKFFQLNSAIEEAEECDCEGKNPYLTQNIKDIKEVFSWLTQPWVTVLIFIAGILILALVTFIVMITKSTSSLVDWMAWCIYSLIIPALLFSLLVYVPDLKLVTFFSHFSFRKGFVVLAVVFVGLMLQVAMMYLLGIFDVTEIHIQALFIRILTAIAGDYLIVMSLTCLIPVFQILSSWIGKIFKFCGHSCSDWIKSAKETIAGFLLDMFNLDLQLNAEVIGPDQNAQDGQPGMRHSLRRKRTASLKNSTELKEMLPKLSTEQQR